ncbi:MAG: histidine ammonia-lyase [Deltaproteobacteria bacterium]|nr:MAG: histidine ammonia-lyase [Deltaproteobacteria bacterium]
MRDGDAVEIGDVPVDLDAFARVVWDRAPVVLSASAVERVSACAAFVASEVDEGRVIYGITTGFGSNRDTLIDPSDAERMQEKLILSHACGVGAPLPESVVRGMMLLRVAALVQGHSGVRVETLQLLVDLLNRGIHPVVPEHGSVGASGDLCPLAHMVLPIIGVGEVVVAGERKPALEAMREAGLSPRRLTFKEGLALLNGTQAMTSLGLVVLHRFRRLLRIADAACALSLEAVAGRLEAFDERIHVLRGRPGQIESARRIRRLCEGSQLAGADPSTVPGKKEYVQDSYCLRCAPQVHGASLDAARHVASVLLGEANAVTDNPLVFPDDGDILSGGNFHGQPVAMALDYLKIAVAEIGNISERRSAKIVDKAFNEGLPAFLVSQPGLNSGHMIPQYVAAALVAEGRILAHPASVDSIPTSANMEDHVSMGHHAGRHAFAILELAEQIVGIELLIAAQAVDLRHPLRPGRGCADLLGQIRGRVSFLEEDRYLAPDLEAMKRFVRFECVLDDTPGGVV